MTSETPGDEFRPERWAKPKRKRTQRKPLSPIPPRYEEEKCPSGFQSPEERVNNENRLVHRANYYTQKAARAISALVGLDDPAKLALKLQSLGLTIADKDETVLGLLRAGLPVTGWEATFDYRAYLTRRLMLVIENPYNQRVMVNATEAVMRLHNLVQPSNQPQTAVLVKFGGDEVIDVTRKTGGDPDATGPGAGAPEDHSDPGDGDASGEQGSKADMGS